MQSLVGYNDVKTVDFWKSGVFFNVERKTNYEAVDSYIRYEVDSLNIGGHMNIKTGLFTAPVKGLYHFSFHGLALKKDKDVIVRMWVNNDYILGTTFANASDEPLSISGPASLKKGDQVGVWLLSGNLYDSDWGRYTHFSGMLLEEDLSLPK